MASSVIKPDERVVSVKVSGDYACFTRPDLKVERLSYPCMTPSAARGILDSILWKPEFRWYVRRIKILKPVRFVTVKRNEINSKQSKTPIDVEDKRAQRNSVILRDVSYIIEASIYLSDQSERNSIEKYVGTSPGRHGIFPRRVKKGQCWRRPFFGTREFSAEFMEPEGTEEPIKETIPIGSMLFDIYYDQDGKPEPVFFHDVVIKNGILDCDVPENLKILGSSHLRPASDSEVSAAIYDFNCREEKVADL